MNLVQNFGKDALDMFSWLENVKANPNQKASLFEAFNKIHKYRIHLSQPMGTWMFVMPDDNLKQGDGFIYSDNDDWQPMFEGEWKIERAETILDSWDRCLFYRQDRTSEWVQLTPLYDFEDTSLNDFLTQVTGLKYHDKYTI